MVVGVAGLMEIEANSAFKQSSRMFKYLFRLEQWDELEHWMIKKHYLKTPALFDASASDSNQGLV